MWVISMCIAVICGVFLVGFYLCGVSVASKMLNKESVGTGQKVLFVVCLVGSVVTAFLHNCL